MDKCKFLRQKKQVQINGEWVDTRSYRYILYCDGGTQCMIFKGGTPNEYIEIEQEFPPGSPAVQGFRLDNNGNQYLEIPSYITSTPINYMSFTGKTLDVIEYRGCVVSFLDAYNRDGKGPATDTLIISCSTYNTYYTESARPVGFSCKKIIFRGFDVQKPTGEYNIHLSIFGGSTDLESIEGLSNFNNPNVTSMFRMFYKCRSLKSLDISGWNTSNVTNMGNMFDGCSGLTSLNLRNFNTSNVTSMNSMFYGCSGLTSLDLSNFDTSNVYSMGGMFRDCIGLTSLNVSGFKLPNIKFTHHMFENCIGLTSLDLSGWNAYFNDRTDIVGNMNAMFKGCTNLKFLDLSGWYVSAQIDRNEVFMNCSSLETLDLSGWRSSNLYISTKTSNFKGCDSLKTIYMRNCEEDIVRAIKNELRKDGILKQVTIITE